MSQTSTHLPLATALAIHTLAGLIAQSPRSSRDRETLNAHSGSEGGGRHISSSSGSGSRTQQQQQQRLGAGLGCWGSFQRFAPMAGAGWSWARRRDGDSFYVMRWAW
ncbi:hypothetical protein VE00_07693 [Pseudogymnoascus sp. WSF 3629]|nr:hypothetical protein VE00_07693 [Pseudogymnoascus sp. WSF 3629]